LEQSKVAQQKEVRDMQTQLQSAQLILERTVGDLKRKTSEVDTMKKERSVAFKQMQDQMQKQMQEQM
jgi:hypothetical protein